MGTVNNKKNLRLYEKCNLYVESKFGDFWNHKVLGKPTPEEREAEKQRQAQMMAMMQQQQSRNKGNSLARYSGLAMGMVGTGMTLYNMYRGLAHTAQGIMGNIEAKKAAKAAQEARDQMLSYYNANPDEAVKSIMKMNSDDALTFISSLNGNILNKIRNLPGYKHGMTLNRFKNNAGIQALNKGFESLDSSKALSAAQSARLSIPDETKSSLWNSFTNAVSNPMDTWNSLSDYGKIGVGVGGTIALGTGLYLIGKKIYKKVKDRKSKKSKLVPVSGSNLSEMYGIKPKSVRQAIKNKF